MYETEKLPEIDDIPVEIDFKKTMQNIVLGALTSSKELRESASELLEKYGIQADKAPTVVEIARDAQVLSIAIDDGEISEELRDNRIKALLKKIVHVTAPAPATVDTLGE